MPLVLSKLALFAFVASNCVEFQKLAPPPSPTNAPPKLLLMPENNAVNPLVFVPVPPPVPTPAFFSAFPSPLTVEDSVWSSACVGMCHPAGQMPCAPGVVTYCIISSHWYKPPYTPQ